MPASEHIEGREACPVLPHAARMMSPSDSRAAREGNDVSTYYLATLTCAQSLWLQGKPAQALLQLNHALGVKLPAADMTLTQWPLPYQGIVWILSRRHEDGFMGNPVRHYQHLASRMSGPNNEQRTYRAWACFHLAQRVLPASEFPLDHRQIKKEHLMIPEWEATLTKIKQCGVEGEAQLLRKI